MLRVLKKLFSKIVYKKKKKLTYYTLYLKTQKYYFAIVKIIFKKKIILTGDTITKPKMHAIILPF